MNKKKKTNPVKELETVLWSDPEEHIEKAIKIFQELEPNLTKKQAEQWVQDRALAIREARSHIFAEMETEIEKQRAEEAEEEIITDQLTGIGNRGAYHQRIDFQISNAERNNDPFSLIMVDIDHFKKVNDRYGHAVGDRVLKEVAKTLKNNLRGVDMVARYGGEEFVVILPNTREHEAGLVAEKLRKAIEEQVSLMHKDKPLTITISAGYAEYDRKTLNTAEKLQSAADKALYHAKVGGRNQVQAYAKGMSMPHDIRLVKELDELNAHLNRLKEKLNYKKEILEVLKGYKPRLAGVIKNEIEQIKKRLNSTDEEIESKQAEIKKLERKTA